jgi:hypothetical protein
MKQLNITLWKEVQSLEEAQINLNLIKEFLAQYPEIKINANYSEDIGI